MKLEEALANIKAVLAAFRGTLEEHKALQASIQLIESKLQEKGAEDGAKP